jgi:hypothetical protein
MSICSTSRPQVYELINESVKFLLFVCGSIRFLWTQGERRTERLIQLGDILAADVRADTKTATKTPKKADKNTENNFRHFHR